MGKINVISFGEKFTIKLNMTKFPDLLKPFTKLMNLDLFKCWSDMKSRECGLKN